jgi:hypothetical protein
MDLNIYVILSRLSNKNYYLYIMRISNQPALSQMCFVEPGFILQPFPVGKVIYDEQRKWIIGGRCDRQQKIG